MYVIVVLQFALTMAGAIAASLMGNPKFGLSFLWGGLTALANSVLLAWRFLRGDDPRCNARQHLRLMYRSSLERFFVVAMLLAAGLLPLGLIPLAVLLGFVLGQGVMVAVPLMRGIKVK